MSASEFGPEPPFEQLIEFHINEWNMKDGSRTKWPEQFCPVCRHGWDFHGGLMDDRGIVWKFRNGFHDPQSCFPPMSLASLMRIIHGGLP